MEEVNLMTASINFLFFFFVIAFAILIIFVLKAQGMISIKFFPQKEEKVIENNITPIVQNVVTNNVKTTEAAKIAAIIAAVQHHKNLKG